MQRRPFVSEVEISLHGIVETERVLSEEGATGGHRYVKQQQQDLPFYPTRAKIEHRFFVHQKPKLERATY